MKTLYPAGITGDSPGSSSASDDHPGIRMKMDLHPEGVLEAAEQRPLLATNRESPRHPQLHPLERGADRITLLAHEIPTIHDSDMYHSGFGVP